MVVCAAYVQGPFCIEFRTWISNHIYLKQWDIITYPCPNFNGCLVMPPLKSGHLPYKTIHVKT